MAGEVYAQRPIKLAGGGVAQRGDVIDISDWPNPRSWFENGIISYEKPVDYAAAKKAKLAAGKKAAAKAEKAEAAAPPDSGEPAGDQQAEVPAAVDLPPAAVGEECPYCSRHHRSEEAAAKCAKRASEAAA